MSNFIENFRNPGIKDKDVTAEKFWEERIERMSFYHGTSSLNLPSIQRFGLSPDLKPYRITDTNVLTGILDEHFGTGGYFANKVSERKIYVSSDLPRSIEYAREGPEVMGEMASTVSWLLKNNIGDPHVLAGIKNRLDEFYAKHEPVLLVINSNSYGIRDVIKRDHPNLFAWLSNKDAFVNDVKMDPTIKLYGEVHVAWSVLDQMESQFVDLPIDQVIPAADIQYINSKDFKRLFNKMY